MQKYPEEIKKSIIARMLPLNNEAIPRLAEETGVPKDTLYCWQIKHRHANKSGNAEAEMPSTLSSEERFQVVLESTAMNELERVSIVEAREFILSSGSRPALMLMVQRP